MSKHTPGPWKELPDGHIVAQDGSVICLMMDSAYVDSEQVQDANAGVIAAAPDLLEMAKLFKSWVASADKGWPDESLLNRAIKAGEAALKKAEGEHHD